MDNKETGYHMDYFVNNNNPDGLALTIYSDNETFNRVKLLANQSIRIPLFVPPGTRPWSRQSSIKGEPIVWIGLLDIDAPHI